MRCWFGRHDYEYVARHRSSSQNLWWCRRCGLFYIQHWGLGIGYTHKTPHIGGWVK